MYQMKKLKLNSRNSSLWLSFSLSSLISILRGVNLLCLLDVFDRYE